MCQGWRFPFPIHRRSDSETTAMLAMHAPSPAAVATVNRQEQQDESEMQSTTTASSHHSISVQPVQPKPGKLRVHDSAAADDPPARKVSCAGDVGPDEEDEAASPGFFQPPVKRRRSSPAAIIEEAKKLADATETTFTWEYHWDSKQKSEGFQESVELLGRQRAQHWCHREQR